MTNTFTTQCSHCDTKFRLLPAQLEAAHGMVRCGSCRQVFNAIERLQTGTHEKPAKEDFLIHDDLDINIDSPEFEQELARLAQQEQFVTEAVFSRESQTSPTTTPGIKHTDKPSADFYQATQVTEAPYDEEAWAAALLAEVGVEPEVGDLFTLAEPSLASETKVEPDSQPADSATTTRFTPEPTPTEPENTATEQTSTRKVPRIREEFTELDVEPLALTWKPKPNPWKGHLIWGGLTVFTLCAFIVQYIYFNFDDLARNENSRVWIQRLCPVIGCSMPSRVNVDLIKSSNLMVRKHPEFKDALLIDAVIYNRASYVQAYPLIKLNFLDAEKNTLASRSFSPAEYLGGELAGSQQMPAQIPIRISFEVLIPTKLAEHYSLEFLSPE